MSVKVLYPTCLNMQNIYINLKIKLFHKSAVRVITEGKLRRLLHYIHVFYIPVPDADFIPKSKARKRKMREKETTNFPKPPAPRRGKKVNNQYSCILPKYNLTYSI